MVGIYCRFKEHNRFLCNDCKLLLEYAFKRLEHCKFGNDKGSCRRCPIHCYKPGMREKMCEVMRFSGPKMIFFSSNNGSQTSLGRAKITNCFVMTFLRRDFVEIHHGSPFSKAYTKIMACKISLHAIIFVFYISRYFSTASQSGNCSEPNCIHSPLNSLAPFLPLSSMR